jgi:hypothetical protein
MPDAQPEKRHEPARADQLVRAAGACRCLAITVSGQQGSRPISTMAARSRRPRPWRTMRRRARPKFTTGGATSSPSMRSSGSGFEAVARLHPIRLHLDTSDYAAMCCAPPGSDGAKVRDFLKRMAELGKIQIGLSYHIVFELLQKAAPQYREDRLARARLLVELCDKNAFPYPTDLGQGYRFSTEGLWVPLIELQDFEVENLVDHYADTVARQLTLSRQQRRAFSKRRNFVNWARADERRLREFPWPVPFGPKFAESGEFRRYVLGEIT